MKIIKTTHYRNYEESKTFDYTLFESNNQQEVTKKFKSTCKLLIYFEELQCIAANPEEHWIVFAEGLSKNAYWVKVTVTD